MFPQALWINAKDLPYRGYAFLEPDGELILPSEASEPETVHRFFQQLEQQISRGLYALGYFSFELGYLLERRLVRCFRKPEIPLAHFVLFRKMEKKRFRLRREPPSVHMISQSFNLSPSEYGEAIEKIKSYLAQGDSYQVNFTGKFHFRLQGRPLDLFRSLLWSQRCEYACYLETPARVILSFSPELFLKKRGNLLLTAPMKGTLKRQPLLREDARHKELLKQDEKSRAENAMIVDLLRNDLGKICVPGGVKVKKVFHIKTYPTVHQMISTIAGTLKTGRLYDIFQALFPSGSVTGAPKIRTMEIIRELEKEPRNVYTGAMGFLRPQGDFTFNVAIRTALLFPETTDAYWGQLGVGAGIVWDSRAEQEYEETHLKARFFFQAPGYFSLLETFWWEQSHPNPLLPLHYRRLLSSARYFRFQIPDVLKNFSRWKRFLAAELSSAECRLLRVRVCCRPEGTLGVQKEPLLELGWPPPIRIGLKRRATPVNLYHFHKTTLRQEYDTERRRAEELGLTEIAFFNEKGELLEGAISNIFLEQQGRLYTPPLRLGILPGVLREHLLRTKKAQEKRLTLENLQRGTLYIGNSLRGLAEVKEWILL